MPLARRRKSSSNTCIVCVRRRVGNEGTRTRPPVWPGTGASTRARNAGIIGPRQRTPTGGRYPLPRYRLVPSAKLTGWLILQRYPPGAGMQHRSVCSWIPSFCSLSRRVLACDIFAAALLL